MLNLVPSDDHRHALYGIHFELTKDALLLVTTDGRRLGVLKSKADFGGANIEPVSFTAHRDMLDLVAQKRMANKQGFLFFTIERDDSDATVKRPVFISVQTHALTIRRSEIEHQFPAWRQAVPREFGQGILAFNAFLFDGFHRVARTLGGGTNVQVRGGGTGAYQILIPTAPDFFGVLMPLRIERELTTPSWLNL
jgi:DNA polymerase III sliding clamp (beta) subunit (PCNA family)